jgi:hypothetical protein
MWGQTGRTPLFPNDAPPDIFFISTAESALAGIAALVPVGSELGFGDLIAIWS